MTRKVYALALLLSIPTLASPALAQFGGSRAGTESFPMGVPGLPDLGRDTVEAYITVDGQAEARVRPTELRIVLAVTSEAEGAQQCQEAIEATISQLRKSWGELQIPAKDIVEDFIAILPRYAWTVEKRDDLEVGMEKKVGYRMQTNVHLAVPNDAKAPAALKAAFRHGVTDIIAVDYWSRSLDDAKLETRRKAVKAARDKSEVLLGALFENPPPVINVQEQTSIRYPKSMYRSFKNSLDESVTPAWRRDIPFIRAYRPQNTYYHGLQNDGDVQAPGLPMHPEISVVSTVRLYFRSPAAKERENKEAR